MVKRLPLPNNKTLQNRYRITKQLGHGGMGVVYEAIDERISAPVALKQTFADDKYTRDIFEREAKILANLTHEAFPRVRDYFSEEDDCYLVMELVQGEDLSDLLGEQLEALDATKVIDWGNQILDALEDLHSQGIVHRDIKPANLKLTPRGKIKLLDFGIAKGVTGDMTTLPTAFSSVAAATLQYAPLEQVLGASSDWHAALSVNFAHETSRIHAYGTDNRSDLYSLGATLYHLLTNKVPLNAPIRALSIWAGAGEKLQPACVANSGVPEEVSLIIQEMMEIDREKRPISASIVQDKFNRIIKDIQKKRNISEAEETLILDKQIFKPEQGVIQDQRKNEETYNPKPSEILVKNVLPAIFFIAIVFLLIGGAIAAFNAIK